MPDYGHALQFGTFITPTSASPEAPVALAQLSERLGYDLATFQDHPYQPAFLDTWTLLSYVGAATERIRLSGNVLNLPLRQPAVLARSVASLDLLTGGRIELGLGAGGFWDAIEAMGQTKLTAGQGVDALSEAIDIIRGIWNTGERAPLRVDGRFHHVHGAKRGPAPAHDVAIWLGALKPRMLRLIGRKADGWLPSLPYLQPGDLARGNATIDDAADAAGRAPSEIRRLLNIGGLTEPERMVDQLTGFALDEGVSTFILMGDDPRALQVFADEVIPVVRAEVASERARRGTSAAPTRSNAALARRRSGIDYDAVPASLAASAIEPGDRAYATVRSTYMRGGEPGLVLRPATVAEVTDAVAYARAHTHVPLSVRSGGHGISGRSTNDGGVVIDVGALNEITVLDEQRRLVRIGPGARWMDVAAALQPHGWALSSGDYGGVGVGGLATAGGVGWLVREHGLTIDHLRAAEVVTADGSLVRASVDENAELFWGIRGAGGNLGVVVAFEFEVDEVGDIGFATLGIQVDDTAEFLVDWGTALERAPRDTTSFMLMGAPRPGGAALAQVMVAVDSDDPETVLARLQPFADTGQLVQSDARILPYAAVMANASTDPHDGQGDPAARSGLLRSITPEFAAAAARLMASGAVYFFQIRALGGAVGDVPADATAFAGRDANFSVVAIGQDRERINRAWAELEPHFSGLYLSFETDTSEARLVEAFPNGSLERLRALKAQVDPGNLFRDNFNVAPAAVG
ncbi:LLM class flavin-dependent oxidoreductase [Rathayibacter sp. YIM 133350]|uniref:LLM class flavin-dependent oxidoreductase n=1 Tax=Rathayibacter sp. YIM 133350 TaxID=3131992 RepID=UPI00307D40D2